MLLPDVSDRGSSGCTLVSGTTIVLSCLIISELLLLRWVALYALIQIIKNVVDWHVKRLLMLLVILKSSLRVASSPEQTLSALMSWVTGCLEHARSRCIFNEYIIHVGVMSDALKL